MMKGSLWLGCLSNFLLQHWGWAWIHVLATYQKYENTHGLPLQPHVCTFEWFEVSAFHGLCMVYVWLFSVFLNRNVELSPLPISWFIRVCFKTGYPKNPMAYHLSSLYSINV